MLEMLPGSDQNLDRNIVATNPMISASFLALVAGNDFSIIGAHPFPPLATEVSKFFFRLLIEGSPLKQFFEFVISAL